MRFYLDENLSQQIAVIARSLGGDVTCAQELGRRGLSDVEQLNYAAAEGRCLVTADYKDFSPQGEAGASAGLEHAGIINLPRSMNAQRFSVVAQALLRFERTHPYGIGPSGSDWLS